MPLLFIVILYLLTDNMITITHGLTLLRTNQISLLILPAIHLLVLVFRGHLGGEEDYVANTFIHDSQLEIKKG